MPVQQPEQKATAPAPIRYGKAPRYRAPAGACDTHFHFFGPQNEFPFNPGRPAAINVPHPDSTMEDWLRLQDRLGLSRGVLVQSALYYPSYELLLHALCSLPNRLRGVVTPRPGVTDRELRMLTEAGVVGIRFSNLSDATLDDRLMCRTDAFGWGVHYGVHGERGAEAWRERILGTPGRFVLEHFGLPPISEGVDGRSFRFVLECLDTGRCWVKLSPRFSQQDTLPFSDLDPFVARLVRHAPERLLWGSDWPHPIYYKPMPDDADLLDMLLAWAPDEATRTRIMVDNPSEAFGFPAIEPARPMPAESVHY